MGHIDSIRGIAALLVVYAHSTLTYSRIPAVEAHGTFLYTIAYELGFGRAGVIAFFAISGFVICPSLKGGQYDGARKFLISRFFRLFPAFWMSMVLALLANFLGYRQTIQIPQVLGNIPMLYTAFHVYPLQGLYWTLEVELIFYFLCLTLFLCGALHKPIILFIIGLVLMAASQWIFSRPDIVIAIRDATGGSGISLWPYMPWNLAIMFWGGLFRIWYDDREKTCSFGPYEVPIGVLVSVLLFAILWRAFSLTSFWVVQEKFGELHNTVPYFLGLGIFMVGALYIKLNNRFFVWLGTVSYSLYLFHFSVVILLKWLIRTKFPDWGNLHLGVYLLVCMLLSILLAGLVYHCIEKPAIELGRFIQNRKISGI
jgi:peptidoglycan/LPS O-acetylase OafA/YrhL